MITTQTDLDFHLDRTHTITVSISPVGPLPQENPAYAPIRNLPQMSFEFTPRDLLHAIGCKTAVLPISRTDECLKSAWLYTHILDLKGPFLSFQGHYGSDLQAARSQEIGIGMMCLFIEKYFGIPWDQLGPMPGIGMRFDYRGTNGLLRCIFESKGTSHRAYQSTQIDNGLAKKQAHHMRGEYFDVEMILSTFIGHGGVPPRLLIADPDRSSLKNLYERGDHRYYRLKHYCRVLQYIGLPNSAYQLNLYARDYLTKKLSISRTIKEEKIDRGFLKSITIDGDEFFGRWFDSWLPKESTRYKGLYTKGAKYKIPLSPRKRYVFQGLRRDIYESGLTVEPFNKPLLDKQTIQKYHHFKKAGVSVFTDGTLMIFRQTGSGKAY